MNMLKRYMIWLRRMSHSRGFGVQSPSAYRFIRYVLCEHYPYYAYGSLRRKWRCQPWLVRKRMELYLRLANFRQADVWLDNGEDSAMLCSYVSNGCRKTKVESRNVVNGETVGIARVCPVDGCEAWAEHLFGHAGKDTLLIVEDIADNPTARRIWQRLVESESVSVSYDLYYLGVAFFDTDRYKTNYLVNF